MKNILNFILITLILLVLVSPDTLTAQGTTEKSRIIPECGRYINGKFVDCGFNDLMQLIKNFINELILFSFPVATIVFAYAGFLYMTTGVQDNRKKAKDMLVKVFWGYAILLSAWLIVQAVASVLLKDSLINPFIKF